MSEYKGIHCHVIWGNEDPAYFYISFGTYDYDKDETHDSYGVHDDNVFFYLSKDEQEALLRAIANKAQTFSVTDEWYIDFVMGYELEPA